MKHTLRDQDRRKILLLPQEMLDELGIVDKVDIALEPGRIVITAPSNK